MSSKAWINVLEMSGKKRKNKVWQEIFVSYKRNNFYRIYHPLIRKIHKTLNIYMNEGILYDKSEVNP